MLTWIIVKLGKLPPQILLTKKKKEKQRRCEWEIGWILTPVLRSSSAEQVPDHSKLIGNSQLSRYADREAAEEAVRSLTQWLSQQYSWITLFSNMEWRLEGPRPNSFRSWFFVFFKVFVQIYIRTGSYPVRG